MIPSGKLCASIHIARAVCRRTEQRMSQDCPSHLYIKRLSDYLLMISYLKTTPPSGLLILCAMI